MKKKIWPIILSGGSGSRLWPLSRSLYPKQLLALTSPDRTMLQETVLRVDDGKHFHPAIIVANEEHRFIIADQLQAMPYAAHEIILEPAGRNTAPAVALGALAALDSDPDAIVIVMPSDHVIADHETFNRALQIATKAADTADALVTFGIRPDRAETGYGYIERGAPISGHDGCFKALRFVEKPDAVTAASYLASQNYLWNSGLFVFRAARYMAELDSCEPAMAKACRAAMKGATKDLGFARPDKAAFLKSPANSIDYAVMEKTSGALVVPVEMGWSDVGSFAALWEVGTKGADGNVVRGDVLTANVQNSLLISDGPAIAAVGLEDALVVATADAVLVAAKESAQDVKAIVEQLQNSGRDEHISHVVVHRPWGSYQTTDAGERFQTKRLVVKPGQKLSLQKHSHRAEHWIVVQGTARVTRGEETIVLYENESTYIPTGTLHRLENPGKIPLHIIEVQTGSYLGEDDIERIEDTYGRS